MWVERCAGLVHTCTSARLCYLEVNLELQQPRHGQHLASQVGLLIGGSLVNVKANIELLGVVVIVGRPSGAAQYALPKVPQCGTAKHHRHMA